MKYDWSKPLGQRRPKVMERMPNPPSPTSFAIDEAKMRSALPPKTSTLGEDLRVLGAFASIGLISLCVLALIADFFLHFMSGGMFFVLVLFMAGLWLVQRWLLPDAPPSRRG